METTGKVILDEVCLSKQVILQSQIDRRSGWKVQGVTQREECLILNYEKASTQMKVCQRGSFTIMKIQCKELLYECCIYFEADARTKLKFLNPH